MNLPREDGALPSSRELARPDPASRHRSWRPWRSKVLWASTIALVATIVVDALDSHDRRTALRDGLRAFNRRWANPLILRFAGTPPWSVARLDHRGRRSGAHRGTPLWAEPVSGGFLIAMPYGTDVDWAKNLIHAGEGLLKYQGVRYRVGSPRIVPAAEALPELPALIRLFIDMSGIRQVMRVNVLPTVATETPIPV